MVPVLIGWNGNQCIVRALIDSGAAGNFLDANLARQLHTPLRRLAYPITVLGVTGERMVEGLIRHRTHPFVLQVGALHTESVEAYVLPQAKDPLIQGLLWLKTHDHHLEWRTR